MTWLYGAVEIVNSSINEKIAAEHGRKKKR